MKKNTLKIIVILIAAVICIPGISSANDLEARAIMQKLEELSGSTWNSRCNMTSDIEMEVIDRDNKKLVRRIQYFTKCKESERLTLAFFSYPSDVKNIGYLSHDYDDPKKKDASWIYLPSLMRVRRVVSSEESKRLMGIDISQFSGLSFLEDLENYDCSFYKRKEMDIDGVQTWAIELIPDTQAQIDKTGYVKHLFFIRRDNNDLFRLISFEQKDNTRIIINFKKAEVIDGVRQYTDLSIKKKQGRQVVQLSNIKFSNMRLNQSLNDKLFTVRTLKKGMTSIKK